MPIYRFRCAECKKEEELILPMADRNNPRRCECGGVEGRVFELPAPAVIPVTGREMILGTLNQEPDGGKFPGGDKHRKRYEQAMAKGLDPPKRTIGKGF